MVDISKVVAHWRTGAREDWDVATDLVERGRLRHGLVFAHLALDVTPAHARDRRAGAGEVFEWLMTKLPD